MFIEQYGYSVSLFVLGYSPWSADTTQVISGGKLIECFHQIENISSLKRSITISFRKNGEEIHEERLSIENGLFRKRSWYYDQNRDKYKHSQWPKLLKINRRNLRRKFKQWLGAEKFSLIEMFF
jgi:hypothetical protein